jgi:hypothetical protein
MIVKQIKQVALKHLGHRNHWLEPAAHGTGIPQLEKAQSGARIGTFPEMAKLFFERPGATDFEIAIEQRAQLGAAPAVELFRREEKKELAPLEGLFSSLLKLAVLGAPHLIDRFIEMFGDVEAVMHNLGLRHLGFGRCLKSRTHVHDDGFYLLALLGRYTFEKSLGTGSFPTFGDFQHPRAFGIT